MSARIAAAIAGMTGAPCGIRLDRIYSDGAGVPLPQSKRDRTAGMLTMKPSPQIRRGFAYNLIAALATLVLGLPMQGHAAPRPQVPQASVVQAPGAARLELLTPVQRSSLPDSVIVTLIGGRTATMRQVRQEHDICMQRFASARALGSEWLRKIPVNQNPGNQGSNKSPLPMQPLPYAAKDYTDFCTAAQATACLYFPAGVSSYVVYSSFGLAAIPPVVFDFDPLITDSTVCSAGGGYMLQSNQGCGYAYPIVVTPNFTPGNYTAPATFGCSNGMFSETYDPHGAVQIKFTGGIPIVTTNASPPGLVCIVRVIPN